jgi:hypothetical protein
MDGPNYTLHRGRTGFIARVFIKDTRVGDGSGLTGLTSASAGLTCYRLRDDDGNAGGAVLALVAGTRGSWSSGGFVEKDAANAPGWYELGLDNAGLVAGSECVDYHLKGAANMGTALLRVQLVAFDPQLANLQADVRALYGQAILTGSVFVGAAATTTDFDTSFTVDTGANSFVAQALYFTSGINAGRTFRIGAYTYGSPTAGRVHLTVSTMPVAPASGDSFIVLGRIGS